MPDFEVKGDTHAKPAQTIAAKGSKTCIRNRRNGRHKLSRLGLEGIQPSNDSVLRRNRRRITRLPF